MEPRSSSSRTDETSDGPLSPVSEIAEGGAAPTDAVPADASVSPSFAAFREIVVDSGSVEVGFTVVDIVATSFFVVAGSTSIGSGASTLLLVVAFVELSETGAEVSSFAVGGGVGAENDGKGFEGTNLIGLDEAYSVFEEAPEDFPAFPAGAASNEGASEIWNKTSAILVATCWSST